MSPTRTPTPEPNDRLARLADEVGARLPSASGREPDEMRPAEHEHHDAGDGDGHETRGRDGAPAAVTTADGEPASTDTGDDDATSTSAFATLKRTFKHFNSAGLTDWAAALTYYGLQAVFPGLIALVSVLGLFGNPATTTKTLTDIITNLSPGTSTSSFIDPINAIIAKPGAAGVLFVVGLATALWSASSYVGAFMRASNAIYDQEEGRPFWKLRPLQVAVTVISVTLLSAVLLGLVLTGPVIDAVAGPLGIGDQAVSVWNIAKWPVMLFATLVILGVLYFASPNVKLPKFRLVTPGAIFALVIWAVASAGFAFYVGNFGSYDKTYGTLGGVISLLVWMWISNCALLLGAALNAEVERSREIRAGSAGPRDEIQLDPRQAPKSDADENEPT